MSVSLSLDPGTKRVISVLGQDSSSSTWWWLGVDTVRFRIGRGAVVRLATMGEEVVRVRGGRATRNEEGR